MRVIDVDREERMDVMLAVDDTANMPIDQFRTAEHFERDVPLFGTVSIGPLRDLRAEVMDACERRGLNCEPAIRQFGSLYGLVRRPAPRGPARRSWDPDRELSRVAAVLRLVRPHTMSSKDGARIITQPDGQIEICAAETFGPGSGAFVSRPNDCWIRSQDVAAGQQLLNALHGAELPDRIRQAMFNHELLHWQSNAEVRWVLLATALEGLVHSRSMDNPDGMRQREQFVVRLDRLRDYVPELTWTTSELDELYSHRNDTMHGGDVSTLWRTPAFPPLYQLAEDALRSIVRAAVLRKPVAEIFETDASIRTMLGSMPR